LIYDRKSSSSTNWSNKPVGSGSFVAENMLMTRYSFWFTNISMSFPGEGYINLGF